MPLKMSHYAVLLSSAAAIMAPAAGFACSLEYAEPMVLKKMMAKEIAHRLGIQPQQVPLNQITQPKLHTPLGLGADCSGLGAHHHSSGFRIRAPGTRPEPVLEPVASPAAGSAPKEAPRPLGKEQSPASAYVQEQGPRLQQGVCSYEGVAVVLGYGYSSPVAVNFEQLCD